MKLKNIDWSNVGYVVSLSLFAVVILAKVTEPKHGPTIEEQLKVIQANQQTMTKFLVQSHNRLNKRQDILELRQNGALPLPKEEK